MAEESKGRALVVYTTEPPARSVAATGGPLPLPSGAAFPARRAQDRRRPGRLPDALLRGLLLDRLA